MEHHLLIRNEYTASNINLPTKKIIKLYRIIYVTSIGKVMRNQKVRDYQEVLLIGYRLPRLFLSSYSYSMYIFYREPMKMVIEGQWFSVDWCFKGEFEENK